MRNFELTKRFEGIGIRLRQHRKQWHDDEIKVKQHKE